MRPARLTSVLIWLLIAIAAPVLSAGTTFGQSRAVAIVVHPDVAIDDLPFTQLRRVFLGEQQFWADGRKITLLIRAPEAYERDMVLQRIYEMNEGQFQQYWIAKIFRSEVSGGPKIVYSTSMAGDLVKALPGSITFMRASDVGDYGKVLKIDGLSPGDSGYQLQ